MAIVTSTRRARASFQMRFCRYLSARAGLSLRKPHTVSRAPRTSHRHRGGYARAVAIAVAGHDRRRKDREQAVASQQEDEKVAQRNRRGQQVSLLRAGSSRTSFLSPQVMILGLARPRARKSRLWIPSTKFMNALEVYAASISDMVLPGQAMLT